MVALCNDDKTHKAWAKKESFPWPTLLPKDVRRNALAQKYQAGPVPRMVIIDKDGKKVKEGHPESMFPYLASLSKKAK